MSKERDHDQLTDRLLRQSFAAGRPLPEAPGAPCLDVESLAAWTEGGLDAAEAAQVERHLSTCPNCQAVLAALAETEPAAAVVAPTRTFWERWSMRWFVPVTAGLSAVLVWSLFQTSQPPGAPTQVARSEQAATDQVATGVPPPVASETAPAAAPERRELEATSRTRPAAAALEPPAPPSAPKAAPSPAPRLTEATPEERVVIVAEAPLPQQAPDNGRVFAGAARESNQNEPQRVLGQVAALPLPERNVPRAVGFEFAASSRPGAVSLRAEDTPAQGGAGRSGARQSPPAPSAASAAGDVAAARAFAAEPPPIVRWRIYTDGTVERGVGPSPTAWQPVSVTPPAPLTSGAATSGATAWLVGRGGVVYRSTDGLTFRPVASPVSLDLTGIVLQSDTTATVTAADGRVFTTADGGQTWK